MNEKITTAKNFVRRHKTAIVVTTITTATLVIVVQRAGIKQLNEFLKEHDLYDTYYTTDEI